MMTLAFRARCLVWVWVCVAGQLLSGRMAFAQPGSMDPAFRFAVCDIFPSAMALQADGKILIGGGFKVVDGQPSPNLARLDAGGVRDGTLSVGRGVEMVSPALVLPGGIVIQPAATNAGAVNSIDVQSDGKILIVGNFNRYNGSGATNIARLNANGSLDPTFITGSGLETGGNFVRVLSGGKILVSGSKTYRGTPLNLGLARLHPDGSLDSSFTPPVLDFGGSIGGISFQADGKIVGSATYVNGSFKLVTRLIRLNENGTLDPTFAGGVLGAGTVSRTGIQPGGKIVVSGVLFTTYDGVAVRNLFRVGDSGGLDTGFDSSAFGAGLGGAILVEPSGHILAYAMAVAGSGFMRLNPDGTPDPGFTIPAGHGAFGLLRQPDGKILVSGNRAAPVSPIYGVYRLLPGDTAVAAPPVIVSSPVSRTVVEGESVTFEVTASGAGALSFQWSRDGVNLPGATAARLVIQQARPGDAGEYRVIVSNGSGGTPSAPARLTVNPAPSAPTLRFNWVGGSGLSFDWPAGYVLQATENLLSPVWTDVPGAPPQNIPAVGEGRFFRLIERR